MAEPVRGDRFIFVGKNYSSTIRVMAVADGYAMVRRPFCLPFVLAIKEFTDLQKIRDDTSSKASATTPTDPARGEG